MHKLALIHSGLGGVSGSDGWDSVPVLVLCVSGAGG